MKKYLLLLFFAVIFKTAFCTLNVHMLSVPDTVVTTVDPSLNYNIDLDNNGVTDLRLTVYRDFLSVDPVINAYNNNTIDVTTHGAAAFTCGSSFHYYDQDTTTTLTNFIGVGARYMFCYFYDGFPHQYDHYDAWIKMQVINQSTVIVYGWAYTDNLGDADIVAGQGECVTGVADLTNNPLFDIIQQSGTLHIQSAIEVSAAIYTITGDKVANTNAGTQHNIPTGALPTGIYILSLTDKQGNAYTKKVVL